MNEEKLRKPTIASAAEEIRNGKMTPTELVEVILERISRINGKVNAYVDLFKGKALGEAKEAEKEIKSGRYKGPLHGIPVGIKDVIDVRGTKTTAGSRVFVDNFPSHEATVVKRLRDAGAIIMGKLNTHELSLGVTTQSALFGLTRNPWNTDRIVGGSSGGPAAAVASSLCLASVGTDGGGSVRIPASLCGVVGLKPTFGRVSRFGVLLVHWTLEHVGFITKTVEDAAIVLNSVAGGDPKDPSSSDRRVPDYRKTLSHALEGVKMGYISEHTGEFVNEEVERSFKAAVKVFQKVGADVEEVSLPWAKYSNLVKFVIIGSEAASVLWEKVKQRAGEIEKDTRIFLASGALFSAMDYVRTQRIRSDLNRRMLEVFKKYDLLLDPTCPVTAPEVGATSAVVRGGKEIDMKDLMTRFCSLYNMPGLPAMSVPCGFDSRGLPIGLQIAGRAFEEELVLRAGYAYQANTDWHTRSPKI